jgi:hypothetical protein
MTTPIQHLIEARRRKLGLSRDDVVRRCGYANLSKGHRRLDALLGGELHTARGLIDRLPSALDVPAATVIEAIAATRRQQEAAADKAYRAAFKPHAIIITEHERPTSITLAAFTGADRDLWVDFELGSSKITYVRQALRAVRKRSPIPYFGQAVGVVVNYSPDNAIRFDLDGNAVELLSAAHRLGELTVAIRGKPVPPGAFAAILGT